MVPPSKDPLPSSSCKGFINGTNTDIVCGAYSDYNFILITNYSRPGTFVRATVNDPTPGGRISSETTYTTKVLSGIDDEHHHVFARAIAQCLTKHVQEKANAAGLHVIPKPLLCCLSLKCYSKDTLMDLTEILNKQLINVF